MTKLLVKLSALLCVLVFVQRSPAATVMSVEDLLALEQPAPGIVIPYGSDPLQFGELNLPEGQGPYPVIVWIHGGCWLAEFDITHSRMTAKALAGEGFAVWNLEYRRVGNPGGGWPNTFLDVAAGADHLRLLAKQHPLDLTRVFAGGHSAGGHLALWLAAREKIAPDSEIHTPDPLTIQGVLALAPAPQLAALHEKATCDGVVEKLMGGPPSAMAERYAAASPARMAPIGLPQKIVLGLKDDAWTWVGRGYIEAAHGAEDRKITITEAPDSGHFEMVYPGSSTWPLVLEAAHILID